MWSGPERYWGQPIFLERTWQKNEERGYSEKQRLHWKRSAAFYSLPEKGAINHWRTQNGAISRWRQKINEIAAFSSENEYFVSAVRGKLKWILNFYQCVPKILYHLQLWSLLTYTVWENETWIKKILKLWKYWKNMLWIGEKKVSDGDPKKLASFKNAEKLALSQSNLMAETTLCI